MAYVMAQKDYSLENPYFSFSDYVKSRFSKRVGKISIDAGYGCVHALKRGGCAFCNISSFRPGYSKPNLAVRDQWQEGRERLDRYDNYYAYMQAGTNSGGDFDYFKSVINELKNEAGLVGYMIGTRVDALDEKTISFLSDVANEKEVWLELGLQSAHDKTLEKINRGHSVSDFVKTLDLIESFGNIYTAAHLVFGLPGEKEEDMLESVRFVSSLPLSGVKFHHLQIVKDTVLEKEYNENPFPLFSADEYIDLMLKALAMLNPRFVLERIVGNSSLKYLLAPKWDISKSKVLEILKEKMRTFAITQGCDFI